MAVQDYQQTNSWTEAVVLGRSIAKVIEELPKNDEYGLIPQLQHAVVDLPAAVGRDLQRGTTDRLDELIRLSAIMALVETVYPALDVTKPLGDLATLQALLVGSNFEDVRTAVSVPDPQPVSAPSEPSSATEESVPAEIPAPITPPTEEPPASV